MKMKKLFLLKDIVREKYETMLLAENEKEAVRKSVMMIAPVKPIRDMELYKVGEYNEDTGEIKTEKLEKVDWNIYSLPDDNEEATKVLEKKE